MNGQAPARIAVITGGGTGIGAACAARLSADGYQVVLVGRRREVLERTAEAVRSDGGAASVAPADLSDPRQGQTPADLVRADFGRVDVLVNNAGAPATPEGSSLRELSDAWLRTFQANTVSAVLLTTALEPLLP